MGSMKSVAFAVQKITTSAADVSKIKRVSYAKLTLFMTFFQEDVSIFVRTWLFLKI